jgi:transposase-like protein
MKKRYRVAPDVREQILKRIREEGVPVSAAAKDAGIHETTIYGWLGKGAEGAPSWNEYAKLKRENKALLELVGEVTLKLSESQKKN